MRTMRLPPAALAACRETLGRGGCAGCGAPVLWPTAVCTSPLCRTWFGLLDAADRQELLDAADAAISGAGWGRRLWDWTLNAVAVVSLAGMGALIVVGLFGPR